MTLYPSNITQRRREVIVRLGLLDDFQRSNYSSYGWYLNSKGISVTKTRIYAKLEKMKELKLLDKMLELRSESEVVFYD